MDFFFKTKTTHGEGGSATKPARPPRRVHQHTQIWTCPTTFLCRITTSWPRPFAHSTSSLFLNSQILDFQLPNIWFHFLLLRFILAIIHLLNDQIARAVLHDFHVRFVVLPVVPPGIFVPILWELQRRLSLQVNADAVDASLSQALVAESVAPGSLLHHLARQLGDVALAFPADGLASLVDLGKIEGMGL